MVSKEHHFYEKRISKFVFYKIWNYAHIYSMRQKERLDFEGVQLRDKSLQSSGSSAFDCCGHAIWQPWLDLVSSMRS